MPSWIEDTSGRLATGAALAERYKGALCALLLTVAALMSLGHAMSRGLFYDEIVTVHAAALPTWRDVWNFYAQGLDTPSPLSSLVVRPLLRLPGSVEVTARLPFLAAFLFFLYCIYRLVLRRYPAGFALAALFVPVYFDELFFYSYEARVYAFMLAAVSFALLCWQSAEDRPRPAAAFGVWAGLAFAMFCHAFAIVLFLPFAAGEWLRGRQRKTVNWAMWLALLLFPLGYLPTLPGERRASAFYRAQFFAKPGLGGVPELFRIYLGTASVILLLVVCAGLAYPAYRNWSASRRLAGERPPGADRTGITAPEALLLLVLALLPIYGMLAGIVLHAFREPYILSFYLGFFTLFVALFAEAANRSAKAGVLLLCLVCLGQSTNRYLRVGTRHLLNHGSVHSEITDLTRHNPVTEIARESMLPIVFGDHVLYSSFFEYSEKDLRDRMIYPLDLAASAPYPKSITSQLNFRLFGSLFGWHSPEWQSFAQEHSHFLLLRGTDPNVWLFPYLMARMQAQGDVTMRLLAISPPSDSEPQSESELYDVQISK